MEKIMSTTTDTSRLVPLEDDRPLADSELGFFVNIGTTEMIVVTKSTAGRAAFVEGWPTK
jgi:hypothetical protein